MTVSTQFTRQTHSVFIQPLRVRANSLTFQNLVVFEEPDGERTPESYLELEWRRGRNDSLFMEENSGVILAMKELSHVEVGGVAASAGRGEEHVVVVAVLDHAKPFVSKLFLLVVIEPQI